ncbi:MAG TPA: hypothetical protein PLF22_08525 [Pseudomonadales bacterium]|nr:hypothetical protein [Pseudomonadales bacterium]
MSIQRFPPEFKEEAVQKVDILRQLIRKTTNPPATYFVCVPEVLMLDGDMLVVDFYNRRSSAITSSPNFEWII